MAAEREDAAVEAQGAKGKDARAIVKVAVKERAAEQPRVATVVERAVVANNAAPIDANALVPKRERSGGGSSVETVLVPRQGRIAGGRSSHKDTSTSVVSVAVPKRGRMEDVEGVLGRGFRTDSGALSGSRCTSTSVSAMDVPSRHSTPRAIESMQDWWATFHGKRRVRMRGGGIAEQRRGQATSSAT